MTHYIEITPVSKPRMTQRDKWAGRDCVMKYFAFKDTLKDKIKFDPELLYDPHEITFVIPMPKSWSKDKKRSMNGQAHRAKPDIDNLMKAVYDSLLLDDSSVWSVTARKYWGETGSITFEILE